MNKKIKSITILGIDPGIADTGYGVIEKTGSRLKMIDYGCIKTEAKVPLENRLMEICDGLNIIIKRYKPEAISIEKLFFCKNVKTALTVGHARGVVMLCAGQHKLEIHEFTPLQIKQALTSYGKAEKKQVQKMVEVILNLEKKIRSDDAADALAAAICCANSLKG